MHADILKLFGSDQSWRGACVVILDAIATVQSPGPDHILGGGQKAYSPRTTSGRVQADSVCYLADTHTLALIQRTTQKLQTGEEIQIEKLLVVACDHVIGLEFDDLQMLSALKLPLPPLDENVRYAPGALVG
jgi:hypothetical protein